jgi:hypothetical protein
MYSKYSKIILFTSLFVRSRHSVAEGLLEIEVLPVEPIFAFLFSLSAMDMNRLVPFIRVEEKPPASDQENRRHREEPSILLLSQALPGYSGLTGSREWWAADRRG